MNVFSWKDDSIYFESPSLKTIHKNSTSNLFKVSNYYHLIDDITHVETNNIFYKIFGSLNSQRDFVSANKSGIKPLIDGISINSSSRFWCNYTIGWMHINFTNNAEIPIWTSFIEIPHPVGIESMASLHDLPLITIYALGTGTDAKKIEVMGNIPVCTHSFDLCVSIKRST